MAGRKIRIPEGLEIIPPEFYSRPTEEVAPDLLGAVLLNRVNGKWRGGRIVETEAYLGKDDPASHAARSKTPRNSVMFGPPGRAYVYFIYGNYFCFNAVAHDGISGAVLVRALEPLYDIEGMRAARNRCKDILLCKGPGRLCMALEIEREYNCKELYHSEIIIAADKNWAAPQEIASGERIGIQEGGHLPLRFYIAGNPYVSRTPGKACNLDKT
ncbi:MAG: DNA-3-methyladenine glycosylase [Chloroflexi bacterium]|nr:DNA-3-methyladenine glycosylase [Chloroflexota bacterium]